MGNVVVVGGGLAGCEASWQLARRGIPVVLYEMKPTAFSPAHESTELAELVCSNSLRSNALTSAVGLLKEEMRRLNSIILAAADETSVPAGSALAVDRQAFSSLISHRIETHPLITVIRQELTEIPEPVESPVILATGPLTSRKLADSLQRLTGDRHLAFYDAIAPVVTAESLDRSVVYRKSRWDDEGPGDYLNCPMTEDEYSRFIDELSRAKTVPLRDFEDVKYFEGCLPIEVMCERGKDTLRFGPMKPVGLAHPGTGEKFHAVVQLRAENREGTMYNLVGFQTKLTYSEQQRVFRMIPGLEDAEFVRLGSIHRNTFIRAPELLEPSLQMKRKPGLFLAGQLSGVEGYVESAAMGLLAGINAGRFMQGKTIIAPPGSTAHGALVRHLTASDTDHFQPSNINFGLFPPLEVKVRKKERGRYRAEQALAELDRWNKEISD